MISKTVSIQNINSYTNEELVNIININKTYKKAASAICCDSLILSAIVKERNLVVKTTLAKYTYNEAAFLNEDAISYYLLGAYITDRMCWSR